MARGAQSASNTVLDVARSSHIVLSFVLQHKYNGLWVLDNGSASTDSLTAGSFAIVVLIHVCETVAKCTGARGMRLFGQAALVLFDDFARSQLGITYGY